MEKIILIISLSVVILGVIVFLYRLNINKPVSETISIGYSDYELTIYPVNGRALPVSSVINQADKTITFNNLIRYDRANNRVLELKDNTWTVIPNYFSSDYTGKKIYKNNLYSSAKADIVNKDQFDLSQPWKYMMYGPSEDVSVVTSITFENNIYTFTSDIGKIDFDIKGNPISPNYYNFVVYKYNGFSQMTNEYLNNVYKNLTSGENVTTPQNPYIDELNMYIYEDGGKRIKVHKIKKSGTDPNWNLIFYAYEPNGVYDKGFGFKITNNLIGTPVLAHSTQGAGKMDYYIVTRNSSGDIISMTPNVIYRIYRKDGFTNFIPTIQLR
jgi:hypothetical protein